MEIDIDQAVTMTMTMTVRTVPLGRAPLRFVVGLLVLVRIIGSAHPATLGRYR